MNTRPTFQLRPILPMLLWACLGGSFTFNGRAAEVPPLQLLAAAPVNGDGYFLPQLFTSSQPLPVVRLGDAPAFGKTLILTRAQIGSLLAANAPGVETNFSGPDAIKIYRRARTLGESDILGLLTATLQHDFIKDKGQLELRLAQPWTPLVLPDETLALDITELPAAGVTPSLIVRFTLRTPKETLGNWNANLKASVWREVWVAGSQLKRGDAVTEGLFTRERRDILAVREPLAELAGGEEALELSEGVSAGQPLLARMLKPRTVVRRGQRAEAVVQVGALSVRTQVEVLEDGAPGQTIRAVNPVTRRSLTGTVLNNKTILISL